MTPQQRIRLARRHAGLSQAALGAAVGVQRSAVGHWESARGKHPSMAHLREIALITGVQFEWLATGRGKMDLSLDTVHVHVNRTPVEGEVTHVEYHPGRFLPAYRVEAGQLNEWTEVWFERSGRRIVCRQIVGILARRIVCRLKPGDRVERGQRFGVMKFGSRIDLFVPTDATIAVKPGDRVVAGETTLAVVP